MRSVFRLILSAAIVILTLRKESDAYTAYNVSVQRQPQKRVDVIEVNLPQNTENPDRSVQDVQEFHTQGEPKYEIFIKPSKARQNPAGSRKIKIFVESQDASDEKQSPKNSSRADVKQQNQQPIPLTIKTAGTNVGKFQNGTPDRVNSTGNVKQTTRQSEYTQKPNNGSLYTQKLDLRSSHTLRDIPEQVTVYGDDYISQQSEDREKRNRLRSNSERGSVLSSKPVEEYRSSYVPVTNYRDPQIYKSVQSEQSRNGPYVGVTEQNYRQTAFDNQQPYDREAGGKKVLVFEPNTGISVAKADSVHPDRGHHQPVRSNHDLDYDEIRAPSGRRVTNTDEERTDYGYSGHKARNPGRNTGEYTSHHEIRPAEDDRYTNGGYSRGETSHNLSDGHGIHEDRYSSDWKTVYPPRDRYPYAEEADSASVQSTRSPYEIAPATIQSNQGGRPVRQNGYGGFPESYSPNSEEISRPSALEGSNSLSSSPCPNVFKYISIDNDRWHAEIFVRTDEVLIGLRLDIILDGRADIMTSDSIEIKTQDNIRFTILSLKKTLVPGRPERVEIMVKYNADGQLSRIPYIKTIDLNGRMICPSRLNSYSNTPTTRRPVHAFPSDVLEPKRTTERNPNPYHRPAVVNEYPSATRRTTSKPNTKKTTPTDYISALNPDYYEQPNHNRVTTSKPVPNRPLYSNNKPSVPNGHDNRRPPSETYGINPVPNSGNNDNRRPPSETYGINPVPNSGNNNNPRPYDREKRNIPCGKPAVQPRPLITSGQMTTKGQWPWHVAIYRNTVPDLKYICGGSLVTEYHIVTAAHCATKEFTSLPLEPAMLLVYLGKYNLKAWTEPGSLSRDVSRITIHPDFNVTNFRSDIAVLTLSQKVEYNDYIRPVCLWDRRRTHIDDIVGLEGTVVGWGYDETKKLTEELKQAKMPVVAQNVCLWSYPDFFPKFTHNNTYCAGFKNGTSVCNGDSGGGMFFQIKINREEYWFLRGLVSLSASEKNDKICDVRHYVVFADTAQYLPWLEETMSRG